MAKKLPKGITLRKDGRYMWRFKYNNVTYSGYSKNITGAKRALLDKQYEVEHGLSSKEQAVIFDAWFPEWLDTYKAAECKESTLSFYRGIYKRYISPVFGRMQMRKIRMDEVQKFLNRMAEQYSKTTVSQVYNILKNSLSQAVTSGLISKSPAEHATLPKCKASKKKGALSVEQEQIFLEEAKSSSYYPLYRMASLTGMRIGEITGLLWKDIDFDKGMIHIVHNLVYTPSKGVYLDTPKTKTSKRDIPMEAGSEVYNLLKEQRKEQFYQRTRSGAKWRPQEGMEDLVFTSHLGTPICKTGVDLDTEKILTGLKDKGIDLEGFTFHSLRHTFATRAIEAGMDAKVLQSVLGHSTFTMTMDLYCDVMEDNKREQMQKIQIAL